MAMLRITHVALSTSTLVTAVFGAQLVTLADEPTVAGGSHASTSTEDRTSRSQPSKLPDDVLVTVNGTALGEADISFATMRRGHDTEIPPQRREKVLELMIQQELMSQK